MTKKKYISPEAEIERFMIETVMTESTKHDGGIEEGGEEVDPFSETGPEF